MRKLRLRGTGMGRVIQVVSGKLELNAGSKASTGLSPIGVVLGPRLGCGSFPDINQAGAGQASLGGLSWLCDAVSSWWGNKALWVPGRKRYELMAKERNQQKEICIKVSLPFSSDCTSLHTVWVCACRLEGKLQIFLIRYNEWKAFMSICLRSPTL